MSGSSSNEMIKGFFSEVESYIPSLIHGLESLRHATVSSSESGDAEERPDQSKVLEKIHRLVHTIKGASSMVGIIGLSHIAFHMEDALEDVISGKLVFTDEAFRVMSRTIDQFQEYCREFFEEGLDARAMLSETVVAFRRMRGLPADGDGEALRPLLESVPEREGRVEEDQENIEAEIPQEVKGTELPPELLETFYEEAEVHLDELGSSLNILESQITEPVAILPSQREIIRRVRRSVHTLKGAASLVKLKEVSGWAHSMEDLLDWIYEEAQEITPEIISVLIDSGDLLERLVIKPQEAESSKVQTLIEEFKAIMGPAFEKEEIIDPFDEPESVFDMNEILPLTPTPEGAEGISIAEAPEADFFLEQREAPTSAPYRYSRTLRVKPERVDELVNIAGELIIALSAFDQNMDIYINAVSELELSRDRLRDIALEMEVGYEVKALERLGPALNLPVTPQGLNPSSLTMAGFGEFDTMELDRYSQLSLIIRSLNEAAVDVGAISTQLANIHSDFDGYLNRQRVLLSELQGKIMRVRMTPMSFITNRMRRTVRKTAADLGKEVKLVIDGEDIELDRLIWEKITDPLMHILRNAVDHGIEPPALRQALGKTSAGTVRVAASREGNQVVIRITDDGAGINCKTVSEIARKKGLSDRVDEMSENELASLIFQPGFTTRGEISEVSGRGVGLDVVKENIQDLKGTVRVDSWEGKGTQFVTRIPLTVAVVRGLLFTVRGRKFAIPLNEISMILRVDPDNVTNLPQEAVRIDDEVMPLYHLARVLNVGGGDGEPDAGSFHPLVLVVESEGRRGALVIEKLIGRREIVIKSLGSHLQYVKGISGATIMGDGSVMPILNTEELLGFEAVLPEEIVPDREPTRVKPLEILVVDDSVSVRQVVSRLMEDQGWKTRTAKDGLDAMEKVREKRPDLIILDIEMPRMNGYEFMGAIKANHDFDEVPIVILTSRTAKKHREKASALGAKGFVVKPYKDEDFINLVVSLTGRSPQ